MLIPQYRRWLLMTRHITTLFMGEEECKADFIRHNTEVEAHVSADKVNKNTLQYFNHCYLQACVSCANGCHVHFTWRPGTFAIVVLFSLTCLHHCCPFHNFAGAVAFDIVKSTAGSPTSSLGTCSRPCNSILCKRFMKGGACHSFAYKRCSYTL